MHRLELLPRPRLCYLEIPAADVRQSAAFYEVVFGWNIRHRDSDRPSFDDATGNISGAFVTDRAAARDSGVLPSVWVDDIDGTLARVPLHGGEIVEKPRHDAPDSTSWIATFRDPGGNTLRLYQEDPENRRRPA
jgi:predicted enzyme related to lactoylglutathione lyase